MQPHLVLLALFICLANAATYYVRVDGGTRYSDLLPSGQCDGLHDAAYSGSGTNQACAFNDVRFLWAKGVFCASYFQDGPSNCWQWVGQGGDTFIVDQKPGGWDIGWVNGSKDAGGLGLFYQNDFSGAPPMKSGTPSAHTRFLGRNWQNCVSDSAKTQLFAIGQSNFLMHVGGSSYFDVACFDMSDRAQCMNTARFTGSDTQYLCTSSYPPPFQPYCHNGIQSNISTTNAYFTDINLHGFGGRGWLGAFGDNMNMLRFKVKGNGEGGIDMDDESATHTEGAGRWNMTNFEVIGNGCVEQYPLIDQYQFPYVICADDEIGGAGDAIGTPSLTADPAWHITLTNGTVAYNTQDGVDFLDLLPNPDSHGVYSTISLNGLLVYGNMGNQIKTRNSPSIKDSLVIGNYNAMRYQIPGFPPGFNKYLTDFGRGDGFVMTVGATPNAPVVVEGSTIYSAAAVSIEVADHTGLCKQYNSCSLILRNTIELGFGCNATYGSVNGCTGNGDEPVSNSLYGDNWIMTNPASIISGNAIYGDAPSQTCPRIALGETSAVCGPPGLVDESFPMYGYPNAAVRSTSSPVYHAGVSISDDPTDFDNRPRAVPKPTIGALEYGSPSTCSWNCNGAPATPSPATPKPTVAPTNKPATAAPTNGPTSAPVASLPNGVYYLVNPSATCGQFATVFSVNVSMAPATRNINQQFYIAASTLPTGSYTIQSVASSLYLSSNVEATHTMVILAALGAYSGQKWNITPQPNSGYWTITCAQTGFALNLASCGPNSLLNSPPHSSCTNWSINV